MISPEFEEKLKDIFFLVCRYGAVTHFKENKRKEDFNAERLYELCNEGFKVAQMNILLEIRQIGKLKEEINQQIKIARQNKIQDKVAELNAALKIENYKEELLRNLIFAITWQIFNGKREHISRFFTGERGSNELEGKGFEAILNAAKEINKHPDRFALISDLTNNIQIGDLIAIYPDKHEIIEVKTGKKNQEAFRVLKFYEVNNLQVAENRLAKSFDSKFVKQILRIQKQKDKTIKVKEILEKEKGEHPKHKDTRVHLVDNPIVDETYHQELISLLKKLEQKEWAYTNIGGIINVGVYKNDWRFYGKEVLKEFNNDYPVYDLMSTLGITVSEPVFVKPFGDDHIIDLVIGRIKMYIGIDFDKLIQFSNDMGLPMRWSTRKELAKLIGEMSGDRAEVFSFDNKGLIIQDQETKETPMFVGHGMLVKMMFDHIKPMTLVANRKLGFERFKANLNKR